MSLLQIALLFVSYTTLSFAATCLASSATEVTINNLLSKGGAGTVVSLCPNTNYTINGTIYFTAANQELSTKGYPTSSTRAQIHLAAGNDVTTLVAGGWLNGLRLKNVIVDGQRAHNGVLNGQSEHQ